MNLIITIYCSPLPASDTTCLSKLKFAICFFKSLLPVLITFIYLLKLCQEHPAFGVSERTARLLAVVHSPSEGTLPIFYNLQDWDQDFRRQSVSKSLTFGLGGIRAGHPYSGCTKARAWQRDALTPLSSPSSPPSPGWHKDWDKKTTNWWWNTTAIPSSRSLDVLQWSFRSLMGTESPHLQRYRRGSWHREVVQIITLQLSSASYEPRGMEVFVCWPQKAPLKTQQSQQERVQNQRQGY